MVLDSRSMRGFPCQCENWLALVDLAGDEAGIAELALWASRLILVDTSLTSKLALCTGAISLVTVCIHEYLCTSDNHDQSLVRSTYMGEFALWLRQRRFLQINSRSRQ